MLRDTALYFRSVAVVLVLLLGLPPAAWLADSPLWRAKAATVVELPPCTLANPFQHLNPIQPIMASICDGTAGSLADDFRQLEIDAVTTYLAFHNLPLTEYATIYSYGRSDLRTEIRSVIYAFLLGIMMRAPQGNTGNYGSLSPHEIRLYQWMSANVRLRERAMYAAAKADKDSFLANPCFWHPDPDVAKVYGLAYAASSGCSGDVTFGGPSLGTVPSVSYFEGAALKNIYGQLVDFPGGGDMLAQTAIDVAATAVGFGLVATVATLVAVNVIVDASILLVEGPVSWCALGAAAIGAATTVTAVATILVPVLLLIEGVIMAINLVNHGDQLNALSAIDRDLAWVNRPEYAPDLAGMAKDGPSQLKLMTVLLPFTMYRTSNGAYPTGYFVAPEYASQAPLPAHQPSDQNFSVTPLPGGTAALQSSWTYQEPSGVAWTAAMRGVWFVQHHAGQPNDAGSITTTLKVKFPNGDKGLISRFGKNSLMVTNLTKAGSPGSICPADPTTGLTPTGTPSCASMVAASADVLDANGNAVRLQIVGPPSFTSPDVVNFNATGPANQQFSISATNSAAITVDGATLPAGVRFTYVPATHQATLSYTPPPGAIAETRQVSLQATDAAGGVGTQSLKVLISSPLQFLSPSSATFQVGSYSSFAIKVSGAPPIAITPQGYGIALPGGLTFTDLGGGSAILAGTPLPGSTGCTAASGCRFLATQGIPTLTTLNQPFNLTILPPPAAQYIGPPSAIFKAGAANTFVMPASGAITKVTWFPDLSTFPVWASSNDNGLGLLTLSGTPPSGTNGPYNLRFFLQTDGIDLRSQVNVTLNVIPTPQFTSPNFYVCSIPVAPGSGPCSFTITTTQAPGTAITYTGSLPPGATFTDNGNGTATIQGNIGVGGSYPLKFTATNVAGSVTQQFYCRVHQPPSFISAPATTFQIGQNNVFTVMTSASPSHPEGIGPGAIPGSTGTVLSLSGVIPPWLQFTPAGSGGNAGTATLTGTPPPGSQGTYNVTLRAANLVSPDAIQNFAIDVVGPGAMTAHQFLQGSGGSGLANQGAAAALSANGQTAIVGGPGDGAIWIYSGSDSSFDGGIKLTGAGNNGVSQLGASVAIAADGSTAVAGGPGQHAFWVYTKSGGNWTQSAGPISTTGTGAVAVATGPALPNFLRVLVGDPGSNRFQEFIPIGGGAFTTGSNGNPSGVIGSAQAGASLSLSPDGNTIIMGGPGDNGGAGAAWILTRGGSGWTQDAKLTGAGAVGGARFGASVALSADGNTAVVGGPGDNSNAGAVWVFTRSGAGWTPQGGKLTANDAAGAAQFGSSVAVSTDGHILTAGGPMDNSGGGATWFFLRSSGIWGQAGGKQVATRGAPSNARQGTSVALSGSGNTALTGGPQYFFGKGAAWAWRTPDLTVSLSRNGTFLPGQTGSYTVTVGNSGGDWTPPGVSWSVTLPPNLTPAGISAPAGWSCGAIGCMSTTGFLAPGGSEPFTLTVKVIGTGSATSTATVSGKELNTVNNTASDTTVIGKATPVLTWNAPAPIAFGSALGAGQLNATANVPGTFVYTPPAGSVLPVGNNQPLSVSFIPNDSASYTGASANTVISVLPGTGTGGGTAAKLILTQSFARGAGNSVVMTLTAANTGGTAAQNVTLTSAKIGTTSGAPVPAALGTINPGASTQTTITFPSTVGASGAAGVLTISGTYTGGTISASSRIALP